MRASAEPLSLSWSTTRLSWTRRRRSSVSSWWEVIRRLFIANRGEIALRVTRAAHRMGISSILGVSEADRSSVPARHADETVLVGPAAASAIYVLMERG